MAVTVWKGHLTFGLVYPGPIAAAAQRERKSFHQLHRREPGRHSTSSKITAPQKAPVLYYVFDVLVLAGRDVMGMPLSARRDLLDRHILSKLGEPIRESPELRAGRRIS
jgi:ATP-dependent DNA ligase